MAGLKRRPLNSCCGISLRNGAFIIGILCMIAAALTMVYIIFTDIEMRMFFLDLPQIVIKIILAFNLFMTIVISGILVLGVLKERKFFLVIWIILGIILVTGFLITIVYVFGVHLWNKQIFESVVWLLIGLLVFFLYFYLWLVVYCYYLKLKEEDQKLPYYKPANLR